MKSKKIAIAGAILFALGFCMATGVDQNLIQAVYAVVLMGGALVCFKTAKSLEQSEKKQSNKSIEGGVIRDAA